MLLEKWEPLREMVSLRDAMNSLLQESFVRPFGALTDGGPITLPLDVIENENEFVVKASLPGMKPEDVEISVHGERLVIRGETKAEEERKGEAWHLRERRYGAFARTIVLGTPVNAEKAIAKFENGVLTLTLPKTEEARPKLIKVNG